MAFTDYTSGLGQWDTGTDLSTNVSDLTALLESGDFTDWSPSSGIPESAIDIQDYEGTQTVDWSNPLSGAMYEGASLMDMTAQELGQMFADLDYQGTYGGMGEDFESDFVSDYYTALSEELGEYLQFSAWDSGAIGSQAELDRQINLAQEGEAGIWDQYESWESGQMGLYDTNVSQLTEGYETAQSDIGEQKRESLRSLRSQKTSLQSAGASQLTQLSGRLGKAGLGGGGALQAHRKQRSIIANQLKGLDLQSKQARETASIALEGAEEGYTSGLEGLGRSFASDQLIQLQGVESDIASLQSEFEAESSTIYSDWMNNVFQTITSLVSSDFQPEGYEGGGFDPFAGMTDYDFGGDDPGIPTPIN